LACGDERFSESLSKIGGAEFRSGGISKSVRS
jgi:hypothetical protein